MTKTFTLLCISIAVQSTQSSFAQTGSSVKSIKGVSYVEQALKLPSKIGRCERLPDSGSQKNDTFSVILTKLPTLVEHPEMSLKMPQSVPVDCLFADYHAKYTGEAAMALSEIDVDVNFYDLPVCADAWRYYRFSQSSSQHSQELLRGSWTGHQLAEQSWHYGEIEKNASPYSLELSSGGITVEIRFRKTRFRALMIRSSSGADARPRRKGSPLPLTQDEALELESLASQTLANALVFRANGYK